MVFGVFLGGGFFCCFGGGGGVNNLFTVLSSTVDV